MDDSNSRGLTYSAGFFILIGFTIAAFFIAALISIPIWTTMTGQGVSAMEKEMSNPAYSDAIKVIQTITAVIGFLMPAIFVALLLNKKPMKLLGFTGRITGAQIGIVVLIVFFSLLVSGALAYFNELIPLTEKARTFFDKWEKEYNDQVEAIIKLNSVTDYIIGIVIMALVPAVCEEALFRGGLQNFFTRSTKSPWASILLVSFLFSAAHFSYYGFLSRFFLGIMLGLIYQYSGRLWLSILAHFINNLAAITAIYVLTMQGKSIKEAMNDTEGSSWGLLALPAVIFLFILFYRFSKKVKDQEQLSVPVQNDQGDLFVNQ